MWPGGTINLHRGFTAAEFLTALALIMVVSAFAVPGFSRLFAEGRLTASSNRLVHAVHLARSEAITRGMDVALCPTRSGGNCRPDYDWSDGWLVFVNRDGREPPRLDRGDMVLTREPPQARTVVTGNRKYFVFRPHGLRSTNGTLLVCARHTQVQPRAVVISYTGRPRAQGASRYQITSRCRS